MARYFRMAFLLSAYTIITASVPSTLVGLQWPCSAEASIDTTCLHVQEPTSSQPQALSPSLSHAVYVPVS